MRFGFCIQCQCSNGIFKSYNYIEIIHQGNGDSEWGNSDSENAQNSISINFFHHSLASGSMIRNRESWARSAFDWDKFGFSFFSGCYTHSSVVRVNPASTAFVMSVHRIVDSLFGFAVRIITLNCFTTLSTVKNDNSIQTNCGQSRART